MATRHSARNVLWMCSNLLASVTVKVFHETEAYSSLDLTTVKKNNIRRLSLLFMLMGWDNVSELRPPTGEFFITHMKKRMDSYVGIMLIGENQITLIKTCPSATLWTKITMWTDQDANPDLRVHRPATKCLSHGTASILFANNGIENNSTGQVDQQPPLQSNFMVKWLRSQTSYSTSPGFD
jgi:hypothetical protein